jgi:hypothetical protein
MSVSAISSGEEIVRLRHRKRIILSVVLVSVGIHVIAAVVAGISDRGALPGRAAG